MPGNLQPLDQKFPIVTPDGRPTLYFIQWAQQKQIDISAGITAEQALAIIEQYLADHQLQEGSGISISPSGNLSDMPTIAAEVQAILDQITNVHGSILFRGAAGWEALAPGTAGQFLKTNGAGADPAWAAGGGGSGGWVLGNVTLPTTAISSSAQASKGIIFNVTNNFDIYGVRTRMTQKSGTIYRVTLWTVVGGNLGTQIAQTNTWVGAGAVEATRTDMFTAPVTLAAGTTYVILVSATNESNTYAFPIYGDTNTVTLAGVPVNAVQYARIAQATLASGQAISNATGYYLVDILAQNVSF